MISNPLQFKIPSWMLNRNRDNKDGKTSQKYANFLDQALREAWHEKQVQHAVAPILLQRP